MLNYVTISANPTVTLSKSLILKQQKTIQNTKNQQFEF